MSEGPEELQRHCAGGRTAHDASRRDRIVSSLPELLEAHRPRFIAQISDSSSLEPKARRIVGAHPEILEEIRSGKDRKFQFLVGQVMKETKGKGHPKIVTELLRAILAEQPRAPQISGR